MFDYGAGKLIDLLVSAEKLKCQLSENAEETTGETMPFEVIETDCSIKNSKMGRLPCFKSEELSTRFILRKL